MKWIGYAWLIGAWVFIGYAVLQICKSQILSQLLRDVKETEPSE
jgi:hypothetical protein